VIAKAILGCGVLAASIALGCGIHPTPGPRDRGPFRFPADSFAFPNETVWTYDVDAATGHIAWRLREPPPDFDLRCGTMTRAARQFYAAARFDPDEPGADEDTYARLIARVLRSDSRRPPRERVVIPGYPDLQSFSRAHEALVKRSMAGPWQSYLQRGNWRMIFPFEARHQAHLARTLLASLSAGWPPIVHVLRYPQLTINHLVLVIDAEETPAEIRFTTYDPNDAREPVRLTYDRALHAFSFATTPYFPGGPVKAYEVYDGLLY
jgi:hypothetical protein